MQVRPNHKSKPQGGCPFLMQKDKVSQELIGILDGGV